jgi:hypothetical protein
VLKVTHSEGNKFVQHRTYFGFHFDDIRHPIPHPDHTDLCQNPTVSLEMTILNVANGAPCSLEELPEVERVTLLAAKLRDTLRSSTVLTPDSAGYAKSIQRWSDAVEMHAVSHSDPVKLG